MAKKTEEFTQRLQVMMPPTLYDKLRAYAQSNDVEVSFLVRKWIKRGLRDKTELNE